MKAFLKENKASLLVMFGLLFVIFVILLLVSESQFPTLLLSSGVLAVISAIVGVILTGAVTVFLLQQQSESQKKLLEQQSEKESLKDKDIKIYEQKIRVFSSFTAKMWETLGKKNVIESEELIELRNVCFKDLVFYLNEQQIEAMATQVKKIANGYDNDQIEALTVISIILEENLNNKKNNEKNNEKNKNKETLLQELYKSFNSFNSINSKLDDNTQNQTEQTTYQSEQIQMPTFWHFNVWGEEQIEAFKNGYWFLSLIEYGENWRTEQLKQVKPDDVIFLFKRGGTGYIGAFRALNHKIIKAKENNDYSPKEKEDIRNYDIYNAIDDGATLVSCIFVEPIAYNFKGVGYRTVRRRTIERMLNDWGNYKFLLSMLSNQEYVENGTVFKLNENQQSGVGLLGDGIPVHINKEELEKVKQKVWNWKSE